MAQKVPFSCLLHGHILLFTLALPKPLRKKTHRLFLSAAEVVALFLSAFPMFVPSRSWQNDRF